MSHWKLEFFIDADPGQANDLYGSFLHQLEECNVNVTGQLYSMEDLRQQILLEMTSPLEDCDNLKGEK